MRVAGPCLPPPASAWANGNGYFRMTVDGKRIYAHRHIYECVKGPIAEGLVLDHLCRNRWCGNPDHLEPVTDTENKLRGESPPALNHRKTKCPAGHDYKTATDGTQRHCPTCRRARRVASGDITGRGLPADRTECPRGHPYDEENTYLVFRPDGSLKQRVCRECSRQRVRDRRAALRAEGVMPNAR